MLVHQRLGRIHILEHHQPLLQCLRLLQATSPGMIQHIFACALQSETCLPPWASEVTPEWREMTRASDHSNFGLVHCHCNHVIGSFAHRKNSKTRTGKNCWWHDIYISYPETSQWLTFIKPTFTNYIQISYPNIIQKHHQVFCFSISSLHLSWHHGCGYWWPISSSQPAEATAEARRSERFKLRPWSMVRIREISQDVW